MSKEFFDAEAQQHAADLDIVRELRHSDASLYQLAHGQGARWQFNQLKSQREEKDARIKELEGILEVKSDDYIRQVGAWKIIQRDTEEIQSLKQQLAEANKKLSWYQSGEIHTCHAECQRPFCVLHRQLESAREVIVSWIDFEDRSIAKEGPYVGMEINSLISKAKKWIEENKK